MRTHRLRCAQLRGASVALVKTRIGVQCPRRQHRLHCHTDRGAPLTAGVLGGVFSLYDLHEALSVHSAPSDVHTVSIALAKLAHLGTNASRGDSGAFRALSMHEDVIQLCADSSHIISPAIITFEDAAAILGSLEDLAVEHKDIDTLDESIQVSPLTTVSSVYPKNWPLVTKLHSKAMNHMHTLEQAVPSSPSENHASAPCRVW